MVRPAAPYSEPKRLHDDPDVRPQAYTEYVASMSDWLAREPDVMLEAGATERTPLALRSGTPDRCCRVGSG